MTNMKRWNTQWLALLTFSLSVLQAIPWFVLDRECGEWGHLDIRGGFLYSSPALLVALVIARIGSARLKLPQFFTLITAIGAAILAQGIGQIVGGIFAASSGSVPQFIGLQWGFTSIPLIAIGGIMIKIVLVLCPKPGDATGSDQKE